MKKAVLMMMPTLFLCLLCLFSVTPDVHGNSLSITATADSYTESDDPVANHGGSTSLYSYYYQQDLPFTEIKIFRRYTWLKFDLSEIPYEATVSSIILRMHTFFTTGTTNKVGAFLCSNIDWQEMEITWNTSPEVADQPIDTEYIGSSNTDYDFDVTSAVKGKDVVTLVLKTLEPTELVGWADFISKEYTLNTYHPKLEVEYTTLSQQLVADPLLGLFIGGLAIVVVVMIILVAYSIMKRKKPESPSKPAAQGIPGYWTLTKRSNNPNTN